MTRSQVQAKKLDDALGNLKAEAMLALPTDTLARYYAIDWAIRKPKNCLSSLVSR